MMDKYLAFVREATLASIRDERAFQDEKFGKVQDRNVPSFDEQSLSVTNGLPRPAVYGIPGEALAKMMCDTAFKEGRGDIMRILVEEVAEILGAAGDEDKMRDELKQVAAVCVFWIETLAFRKKMGEPFVYFDDIQTEVSSGRAE